MQHNCRARSASESGSTAIQQAMPATEDPAIVEGESRKAPRIG